jgi:hypothetical protein
VLVILQWENVYVNWTEHGKTNSTASTVAMFLHLLLVSIFIHLIIGGIWNKYCFMICSVALLDRLCGLVVSSSWIQIQGSGFDSRRYEIFWEVVGLERGPLSLMSTTEELHERKSSGSGLENREFGRIIPLVAGCLKFFSVELVPVRRRLFAMVNLSSTLLFSFLLISICRQAIYEIPRRNIRFHLLILCTQDVCKD